MVEWFKSNMGTIIVGAFLLAIVAAIIISLVRRKKRGRPILDCGGNCGSCSAACSQAVLPEKYRGLTKTVLEIDGMMCGMCESHINDAIRNRFKVEAVFSSHTKGETVIVSKEITDKDELIKTVEERGYKVVSYSSSPVS